MKQLWQWLAHPPLNAPVSALFIRLMAGGVFFWEGILKFVYANQGVGRFTKIGIPFPEFSAHFVATFEIVGGLLLIFGFLTRFVSVPFIFQMIIAVLTTKVALYLGTSPLPLPPSLPQVGPWAVLHEIRADYAQIMGCLFLAMSGPGPLSLDAWRRRRGK